MGQSRTEPLALNAQSAGQDLNQWGSATVSSQSPQACLRIIYLPSFCLPCQADCMHWQPCLKDYPERAVRLPACIGQTLLKH